MLPVCPVNAALIQPRQKLGNSPLRPLQEEVQAVGFSKTEEDSRTQPPHAGQGQGEG